MLDLDAGVEAVAGVGPRRAATLREAGILTVEDLLLYLPIRYEDRTDLRSVAELEPGRPAGVRGRLERLERAGPPRRRRAEAVLRDDSGAVAVVWFHQPYLAESLPVDEDVILWGTPERHRTVLRFTNPVHARHEDVVGNRSPHLGRPVPVHRRIGDLGPAALRRLIDTVLADLGPVEEGLPETVCRTADLLPRRTALEQVHYPPSVDELDACQAGRSQAHRRLAVQEFVAFQAALMLQRRRAAAEPGVAHAIETPAAAEITDELPFEMTAGQRRALDEILTDLRSDRPMHRLLQGDVGSGKTAVLGAALLGVVRAGSQGALLAPTELLARQHHATLHGWAERVGVHVALLTGSTAAAERKDLLTVSGRGEPLLMVGTHALLEGAVRPPRLGLAVIDEQHRFGVAQRAALRAKLRDDGRTADLLVTTATPIPRSLALTLYGDLEVSVIDELPPGRTPVVTRQRRPTEWHAMADEMERRMDAGEKIFAVSPRIHGVDDGILAATELAAALRRRFGAARVALVHGEMPAEERDATMQEFIEGASSVLVATTIIEVGVDVPDATLMVVDHAERFGLAQLHQLRGRVGRGARPGECWLIGHGELSATAAQRLATLCETTDGFRIAEEDLRLRGPGEVLGSRQTGPLEHRVGDPYADSDWLQEAHTIARELAGSSDPAAAAYRDGLRASWRRRMRLLRAG